jgi:hypothetical protein
VSARVAIAIALAGAIGCSKHEGAGGASASAPPDVAALWAMAPEGADGGLVVSGRAMALAEGAMIRLEELGRASPELGQAIDAFQHLLGPNLAGGKLARWSDVGFAPRGGIAFFHLPGNRTLAILSVADREKFVSATRARKQPDGDHLGRVVCRTIAGRYQCASDTALFDARRAEPDGHRAATLHGDVEAWVAKGAFPVGAGVEWTGDLEIAAAIDPGRVTVRAHVPLRGPAIARFAAKPVAAPGADTAAGLLTADLAPLWALVPPQQGPMGDLLHALAGPVTIVAPAGALDLDTRLALRDAAPVKAMLAACDQLVPYGAGITATPSGDGCHLRVDAGSMPFEGDAWVDGTTLRARRDRKTAPAATAGVAPTALGRELGDGTWTAAVWGRGAVTRNLVPPGTPPRMGLVAAPYFALSELGFGVKVGDAGIDVVLGVRTIWDDPDDVIAALGPMIAKATRGEEITDDVDAIAAKFPNSSYAADVHTGEGGLLLPVAFAGMSASFVIPLLMGYLRAP